MRECFIECVVLALLDYYDYWDVGLELITSLNSVTTDYGTATVNGLTPTMIARGWGYIIIKSIEVCYSSNLVTCMLKYVIIIA